MKKILEEIQTGKFVEIGSWNVNQIQLNYKAEKAAIRKTNRNCWKKIKKNDALDIIK